ncbi:uncharacterized protein K452DRAFT_168404 [Aplosporella prunicola CBS 121167]|uniref:Uncharacterized protein n=1 Tax=Aplosporella prunicola CBS 121167 TaxID=1176127 RepID=A0A6A6BIL6_9PEZI|nr:uncharacterized protein K452DRAFT_168404 [Aplosporella prunicola CBS 121167]KAF2143263.1 hypothetical protein K452DRAFT_168404 [Aplosporella prunicola CBS 121167]
MMMRLYGDLPAGGWGLVGCGCALRRGRCACTDADASLCVWDHAGREACLEARCCQWSRMFGCGRNWGLIPEEPSCTGARWSMEHGTRRLYSSTASPSAFFNSQQYHRILLLKQQRKINY